MNDLLTLKRISSFIPILEAYKRASIDIHNTIDGGAGFGETASSMAKFLKGDSKCYAFEPFPGNHRFFDGADSRIQLIPKALDDKERSTGFKVRTVVEEDSEWGRRGLAGYSSVGYINSNETNGPHDIIVECTRADSCIPVDKQISFVKLDLQGGELSALKGMSGFLLDVPLLWIEFSGQKDLLNYIFESGFIVFDTSYFFLGSPEGEVLKHFTVSKKNVPLSIGSYAWFGFRKYPWGNYEGVFERHKKEFKMVQTDLFCVNKKFFDDFVNASRFIQTEAICNLGNE